MWYDIIMIWYDVMWYTMRNPLATYSILHSHIGIVNSRTHEHAETLHWWRVWSNTPGGGGVVSEQMA